jgi:protein-tyrosine-phosphatase
MAEVLFRHRLAAVGVDGHVRSAGLLPDGVPASEGSRTAVRERGLDLSDHRSTRLEAALVAQADLILGMTREHVREAVVLDRDALTRSFTLRELVGLAERHGARGHDEPLAAWLERIGRGRRAQDLIGVGLDPELDIPDPIGGPLDGYRRTAEVIDDLLRRLVERAWPTATHNREIA